MSGPDRSAATPLAGRTAVFVLVAVAVVACNALPDGDASPTDSADIGSADTAVAAPSAPAVDQAAPRALPQGLGASGSSAPVAGAASRWLPPDVGAELRLRVAYDAGHGGGRVVVAWDDGDMSVVGRSAARYRLQGSTVACTTSPRPACAELTGVSGGSTFLAPYDELRSWWRRNPSAATPVRAAKVAQRSAYCATGVAPGGGSEPTTVCLDAGAGVVLRVVRGGVTLLEAVEVGLPSAEDLRPPSAALPPPV